MSSKVVAAKSQQRHTKPTPVHKAKGKAKAIKLQHPPTPDTSGSPELQQNHEEEAAEDSSDDSDSVAVASSRTPRTRRPPVKAKVDKGKQRAVSQDAVMDTDEFVAPKSRLPRKKVPSKRDVFDSEPKASTSQPRRSPKVLTTSKIPKQSSQTRPTASKIPVKTSAKEPAPPPSSAVRARSRSRARTSSVITGIGEVWSAIKPVPLKTVYRSSPPRVIKISDSASSASGSDDEFLLRASRSSDTSLTSQKSKKRRKPNAGEFEWDEKSRSCIVKRERSRSRSLAAYTAVQSGRANLVAKEEYPEMADSDESESGFKDQSQMEIEDASTYQNDSNILDGLHDNPNVEQPQGHHDNYMDEGLFNQHQPLADDIQAEPGEADPPVYDFTKGGEASSSIAGSESESEDDAFERSVQQIPIREVEEDVSMAVDFSNDGSQLEVDRDDADPPIIKEERDDVTEQDSFLDSFQDTNDKVDAQEQHALRSQEPARFVHQEQPSAGSLALSQPSERTSSLSIQGSKIERRTTSPLPPSSPPPLPASRESTASNEVAAEDPVEQELREELQEYEHADQYARNDLRSGLTAAIQSTPRAGKLVKRLQVASDTDVQPEADSFVQMVGITRGPELVVAPSSSPRASDMLEKIPRTLSHPRDVTPSLFVSDSRTALPTARRSAMPDVHVSLPVQQQEEQARHISPSLGSPRLPVTFAQNRASPFAKLEGLLSPKAGIRRSVSRSPSPLSQMSEASPKVVLKAAAIAGSYRSPRAPSSSTSPQPTPAGFAQTLMPVSPAPNPSLFSTPARLRSARSVSPLLTPNQAHAAQPQASLLQMLRTAAVHSTTKSKETNVLRPALSPSISSSRPGGSAEQDAATSLLQRIDHHRPSISVEVQKSEDMSAVQQTENTEQAQTAQTTRASPHINRSKSPIEGQSEPALRNTSPAPLAAAIIMPATPVRQATQSQSERQAVSRHATKAMELTGTPGLSAPGSLQSPARIDSSAAGRTRTKQTSVQSPSGTAHKSTPNAALLGKSPALQRALAPLDSPQLSPNVTVRRGRSASYSSASTMSVRSKPNTPREQVVRGRKLSFTELGSFDSSPLSVAASIGCHSFEALDGNSDDEDAQASLARPSPSKELAQQQKARFDSTLSSSSSEASEEGESGSDDDIDSILVQTSQQILRDTVTVSSTPAKRMTAMDLASSTSSPEPKLPTTSTPGRPNALANPIASRSPALYPEASVPPVEDEQNLHEDSMFVEAGSFVGSEGDDMPSLMVEGCSSEADLVGLAQADHSLEGDSSNMSIALDEARPRTRLVPPPLTKHSRPAPGRRRSRPFSNPDISDIEPVQVETTSVQISPPAPQRARSGSTISRAGSAVSNASTVVQVSSNDPKAAARAAAILKIHHKYVQEGNWPTQSLDFAEQSGNSPEGERVLDELLKEAELEVSMYTEAYENASQADISVESEDTKPNQSLLPGRSLKHGSHRLAVWTRHDWRNLEQCFIDERRRTKLARIDFDRNEVVRIFLENEQLALVDCLGEWDTEKILLRVEALQARKVQKQEEEASQRARSTSFVSSVWSRAPSEFLSREDSRIGAGGQSTSTEEGSFLQVPGGLAATGRRYARSAEPQGKIYEKRDGYSHLSSRHPSTSMRDGIHRRAASLTDVEAMPQLRKPQPLSSRVSKLYPPLDDLAADMRPKKAMPIKGRSVLAAVNMFEKIEEEQSLEVVKSRVPKRKDISDTVSDSGSSKRVRI